MNPATSPAAEADDATASAGSANGHFIGGTWREPSSTETIEVINSFTEAGDGLGPGRNRGGR